ncbi:bifunctional nicotinamide-nucleotide adenylyltransferase/Nudix hydroxylase [Schlegelella sp. S2-27]|uniref:Bifunctional nicotinamide-nucleotide adenylyltransferase/Nudix hydroxylase n=1 Tax=Caldimonas mangrovi TaxID=2944811 RepID=A0ABT0YPD6_9BURK|nr:bifunctional nicotinamide-nucleotide adenylyltransferase/Nudix hydroxylase [Caldimonas mangrovi]MCM5680600.1 bifunctional nicotinamide-nucleotide adenylyltransferase/Nudix hydroxylase [Caldimonas mangrovi]
MPHSEPLPQRADVAVYIGRFQPFHRGHLALLRQALALAPRCVVVLGSAHQARTPKNPFTWQERAEMVRLALSEDERSRVRFLPVRDYYDETRWVTAVRDGVSRLLAGEGMPSHAHVTLVGHFKDATSEYLHGFPGWRLTPVERVAAVDATAVRDAWFGAGADDREAALAALVEHLPPSTTAFLRAWSALPHHEELAEEWRLLRHYKQSWSAAPYPPVFVTVDSVVACSGRVLLVRRGQAPGKGLLAVPGGFIEQRETAYQSALRELQEETGLALLDTTMRQCLKATAVFDHPDRSQRGRTITHAHYFELGERELPEVQGGDDAAQALWVPVDELTAFEDQFLDDHFHMLDHFLGLTEEPHT